jgi:hypothetical protein
VSAKIIQFVPRVRGDRGRGNRPIAFRSLPQTDDLAMDHADTAPCEYAPPPWQRQDDDGQA